MLDKHHKKESPTFTGITRGVGGFGFGAAAGAAGPQVSDNYWIATLGKSNHSSEAGGVAVDSVGNIYVTGKTNPGPGAGGNQNKILTVKYDTDGVVQWQRTLSSGNTSGNDCFGEDIIVDNSGNIVVVGKYQDQYGIIAKYNTSGELQWARVYGSNTYHFKVDFDNDGNYYTADERGGEMSLTKFNTSGDHEWTRHLDTSNGGTTVGYDVAVDRNNSRVFLVGRARAFSGNTSGADYEGILARYSTSGTLSFIKGWDTNPTSSNWNVWAKTLAIRSDGQPIVFSWASGDDGYHIALSRFTSSGTFQADVQFKMSAESEPTDAVFDGVDSVYVVGYTSSKGVLVKYPQDSTVKEYGRTFGQSSTRARGVAVDNENKAVYFVGYTQQSGVGSRNYVIVKAPADGSMTDSSYDSGNLRYENATTSGSQSYSATYQNVKSPSGTMSSTSASRSELSTTVLTDNNPDHTSIITPMS